MSDYKDYHLEPQAGRFVKEDGSTINFADFLLNGFGKAQAAPLVVSTAITYANSASADTQVVKTIPLYSYPSYRHLVLVYNPSTVTDLTMKILYVSTTIGGSAYDIFVDQVSIPKAQTLTGTALVGKAVIIEGLINGMDAKLIFSNDTVLGGSDGFSAYYEVWKI